MSKLFIFTLNFGTNLKSACFGHNLLVKNRNNHFAQKDAFGLFQYVHFSRAQIAHLGHIEVHTFTRIFYKTTQVVHALKEGCLDIKRFYGLINELKHKENIHILCRIMVHGGVGSEGGFQMEEITPTGQRRVGISPHVICKLIRVSFPNEIQQVFTPSSPLHIQLISCSAGSSQNYTNLETNSLAAALVKSFMHANIFTIIQASTTQIMTTDYIEKELSNEPIILRIFDKMVLSSVLFRERYVRRGVINAFDHLEKHVLIREDKHLMEQFRRNYLYAENRPASIDMVEIVTAKRRGYQLIFSAREDRSISVCDLVTGEELTNPHDLKLEEHRDLILQYFWLEFFYDKLAKKDAKLLEYCIPASNLEILLFIRDIERAVNRSEILAILERCEQTLKSNKTFTYLASLFGKKLFNTLAVNDSFFGECAIQKYYSINNLRKNLENPDWRFESFDFMI